MSRFSVVCVRWPSRINSSVLRFGLGPILARLPGGVPDHARRHPHGELARRDVLVDHASGPKIGTLSYCNRCDKVCIHAGECSVADPGPVLLHAVVVGGYGTGTDVGVLPDLGVAHVGEVRDLAPSTHPRVLDLAVGSHLRVGPEHGTRPQEGVGTDARPRSDLGPPTHGVLDECSVADDAVEEVCGGAY